MLLSNFAIPKGVRSGLLYYDLDYDSCTECTTSFPCVTSTPTRTADPTQTPTLSPNLTPSVTPTITPTNLQNSWIAKNCCNSSDRLIVSVPANSQKIYVFYDSTNLTILHK